MSSHHDHTHDDHNNDHHGHSHAPANFGRAFAIGIVLNTSFVIIEAGYGFLSNSTALLADAGHNLSDVLGLLVAWIAAVLSKRPPTPRLTYGLRNTSILAALLNVRVGLHEGIGVVALQFFELSQPRLKRGLCFAVTSYTEALCVATFSNSAKRSV